MNIPDNITCGMCTYYDYHTDDCTYANNREVDKDGFYIDEPPCRRSQEENAEQSKAGTENNGDLISRSELLNAFNNTGIQITFDLPVEEILGEDVDIDDFTMLVQDVIQAYKKMVIDTIKNQPTAWDYMEVKLKL